MKEDPKLQGLCKECTHRNSCEDARRHLDMTACSRYKHWKKRDTFSHNRIAKKQGGEPSCFYFQMNFLYSFFTLFLSI